MPYIKSERRRRQQQVATALRSLVMIQGMPGCWEICTVEEIAAITKAAEVAERGVRKRYAEYQRGYGSKQVMLEKTAREQRKIYHKEIEKEFVK